MTAIAAPRYAVDYYTDGTCGAVELHHVAMQNLSRDDAFNTIVLKCVFLKYEIKLVV